MGRRRDHDEDSSSDTEGSASESEEDPAYNTDATDLTDDEADADPSWLLEGNDHPPEYYRQQQAEFDKTEDIEQDYKPGTTLLLDRIKDQWHK
jgi:hypothetical protein